MRVLCMCPAVAWILSRPPLFERDRDWPLFFYHREVVSAMRTSSFKNRLPSEKKFNCKLIIPTEHTTYDISYGSFIDEVLWPVCTLKRNKPKIRYEKTKGLL